MLLPKKQNTIVLKKLIDKFILFIHEKSGHLSYFVNLNVLIINFALSIIQISIKKLWDISKNNIALLNHELKLLHLEDIDIELSQLKMRIATN